jgi:hypothetical protein
MLPSFPLLGTHRTGGANVHLVSKFAILDVVQSTSWQLPCITCLINGRKKAKFDLKFGTLYSLSLFTPPSHRSGSHSISLLPLLKRHQESTTAATSNFAATAQIFSFAARYVAS